MAKPYAYVCMACGHLASRHLAHPGAVTVEGPYDCTYDGCDCQIVQSHAMYGIDEAAFNRLHLPRLDNYRHAEQFHELMQSDVCVCGHDQSEHLYGDDHQGECGQCGCQSYG